MFPSIISTFNIVSPSDRLNSPSHSALHNSVSSVLTQVQTVIGTDASTIGTIIGDLRNPASNGGGHVQTANKGGTGLTSYAKGDLLVATSSSVISKLGVSSTAGDVLVADPNQSSGMKWAPVVSNKISTNASSVLVNTDASVTTVLYATSILGSTLGTSNALRFTGLIQNLSTNKNITFQVNYGNNTVSSIILKTPTVGVSSGTIEGMIVADGNISIQKGYTRVSTGSASASVVLLYSPSSSSINSSANQDFVILGSQPAAGNVSSLLTGMFVVEKIA
jgi:hypothetical protein